MMMMMLIRMILSIFIYELHKKITFLRVSMNLKAALVGWEK